MRESFATALVEPDVLIRECLKQILHCRPGILRAAAAAEDSAFDLVCKNKRVLLVIGPGVSVTHIAEQIELFKKKAPWARVIVMAHTYDAARACAAFRAGANGYLAHVDNCECFVESLELVMLGETIVPAEIMSALQREGEESVHEHREGFSGSIEDVRLNPQIEARPHLSGREARILRHLIDGDSNKTIARKLGAAEATVKVHVKAILRKIRVSNRTQAAVWAMNAQYLDLEPELPSQRDATDHPLGHSGANAKDTTLTEYLR